MKSPSARARVRDLMTGAHSPLVTAAGGGGRDLVSPAPASHQGATNRW
jgi:hypothetical protein